MKKSDRKLNLKREVVRRLTDLQFVRGGLIPTSETVCQITHFCTSVTNYICTD